MPKRQTVPENVRSLLEDAGYVWNADCQVWVHSVSNRQLDPGIAKALTVEQITVWIAEGRDRKSF
jgi:hypothetical protein